MYKQKICFLLSCEKNDEALKTLKEALSYNMSVIDRAELLNLGGNIYRILKCFERSTYYYEDSLNIYRRKDINISSEKLKDFNLNTAAILSNMACNCVDVGDLQIATNYVCEALEICKKEKYVYGIANSFNILGMIYSIAGNIQKSQELLNKSLKLFTVIKDSNEQANTLVDIGINYMACSDKKSIEYFNEAMQIFKESSNKEGEVSALNNIAGAYQGFGNLEEAFIYYQKALSIATEVGFSRGKADSLANIATIYIRVKANEKALEYNKKALETYEFIGDKRGKINVFGNYGNIYLREKDYENAKKYFYESLKLCDELGAILEKGLNLMNLGLTYCNDKPAKAKRYYLEALNIFKNIGYKQGEATTLLNLGVQLKDEGELINARKYLQEALNICNDNQLFSGIKVIKDSLEEIDNSIKKTTK